MSQEDSDQPKHQFSLIRVLFIHMKKAWVLSYSLSAQGRLIRLGGCPGQADLGLCWAYMHLVGFIMPWLMFLHWEHQGSVGRLLDL